MADGAILGQKAVTLPTDTTANRPTAATGMLRFNTSLSAPEIYDGTSWNSFGAALGSVANPAGNALSILSANPNATTGNYYIYWGAASISTYCDMTGSTVGSPVGGWMRLNESFIATNWSSLATTSSRGSWVSSSGRWNQSTTDGGLSGWGIKIPSGCTGVKVDSVTFNNISGPDGAAGISDPGTSNVVSHIANGGSSYNLGSNVATFGWSVINNVGNNRYDMYNANAAAPWSGEANGYVTLPSSRFNTTTNVGFNITHFGFFCSDGINEYYETQNYTVWFR